jgi:hypothetical protein
MAGLLTKAPPRHRSAQMSGRGRGYAGLPYSVQYEQLAAYLCKTAFYCFLTGYRTVRSYIISGSVILIVPEHYRQLALDVNLWGNGYGNLVRL